MLIMVNTMDSIIEAHQDLEAVSQMADIWPTAISVPWLVITA